MGIIENNEAILGNNRSILGEILNRIIGRKNRIIGTALISNHTTCMVMVVNTLESLTTPYHFPLICTLYIAPADVLSNSSLNDKSVCQIKAAKFLSHTYLCLSTCSHGDGDVPDTGGEGGVASNVQGTLLLLLEDLSGALHVQLVSVSMATGHCCLFYYIYMHLFNYCSTCIGYITRWRSLCDLHNRGPQARGSVNHIGTNTE